MPTHKPSKEDKNRAKNLSKEDKKKYEKQERELKHAQKTARKQKETKGDEDFMKSLDVQEKQWQSHVEAYHAGTEED